MSGFTLVEALAAVALMGVIIAALATVTAQWLPNWKRGFVRVQRTEQLRLGLERIVADLAAAEFITPNAEAKGPLFAGAELSAIFVRTALGPNASPGLEIIRFVETADDQGFALVRERAPFVPLAASAGGAELPAFSDPVVLVRAPYRIRFSYAGSDRTWRDTWRNSAQLPSAVRVSVRSAGTEQILSASTATLIHVDLPVECVIAKSASDCINKLKGADDQKPAAEKEL
ncbi:general secretion pathway protein J [Rhizobiales bacterium GAS191]|nr:general secretion pathway protein J [Rhizobiales bacterium GAS191]